MRPRHVNERTTLAVQQPLPRCLGATGDDPVMTPKAVMRGVVVVAVVVVVVVGVQRQMLNLAQKTAF